MSVWLSNAVLAVLCVKSALKWHIKTCIAPRVLHTKRTKSLKGAHFDHPQIFRPELGRHRFVVID